MRGHRSAGLFARSRWWAFVGLLARRSRVGSQGREPRPPHAAAPWWHCHRCTGATEKCHRFCHRLVIGYDETMTELCIDSRSTSAIGTAHLAPTLTRRTCPDRTSAASRSAGHPSASAARATVTGASGSLRDATRPACAIAAWIVASTMAGVGRSVSSRPRASRRRSIAAADVSDSGACRARHRSSERILVSSSEHASRTHMRASGLSGAASRSRRWASVPLWLARSHGAASCAHPPSHACAAPRCSTRRPYQTQRPRHHAIDVTSTVTVARTWRADPATPSTDSPRGDPLPPAPGRT